MCGRIQPPRSEMTTPALSARGPPISSSVRQGAAGLKCRDGSGVESSGRYSV